MKFKLVPHIDGGTMVVRNDAQPTYNDIRRDRERDAERKRWSYGWSPSLKKAFIVDGQGFTVIGAVLSAQAAGEICRQHNATVRSLIE
jgi:hypothetical protein